jgi:predicted porin
VSSKNARSSRLFTALFSSGVAGAALFAGSAGAVSIQGGDWELDVGGIVNAYYTAASCSGTQLASGVAMANKGLGCAGENHKTTIGNGLLPSGLITKFKTTQDGIDIGGTVGIMVHAATSSGVAPNSGVDVRQAFFTLGTADAGTLKIGRDYGIFGSNAILTDMTLLGVGAPAAASQRDRVALGHIGSGYTYLDNYGQMTYTSPTFGGGFTFTGGVFSPVDAGLYVSKAYPQLQAQLSYSVEGLKVWAGGKTQKFYGSTTADNPVAGDTFTEFAGELGVSWNAGPFGLLANVQSGKGIGILSDGDQGDAKGLNYLVQGSYKLTEKLKFGLNYGISKNRDDNLYNDTYNLSFKQNTNVTGGLYYQLTKSVTLAAELVKIESKDYLGNEAKQYGGDVGGIIFF